MQRAVVIGLVVILVVAGGYYAYKVSKPDLVGQFNVSSDKITKDLEGRTAPLPYGQVWPFEPGQGLTVKIVGKKQVEDYVQVVVELHAVANVEPPKTDSKDKKEEKTPAVKSFKVALTGLAKLTYERVQAEWYIVGVDSLSLRAHPLVEMNDTKKQ